MVPDEKILIIQGATAGTIRGTVLSMVADITQMGKIDAIVHIIWKILNVGLVVVLATEPGSVMREDQSSREIIKGTKVVVMM